MDALYIDTPAALAELAQRLRASEWLGLDTEFMRDKSYFARLCLLQIANSELVACIDPLALPDLGPLLPIIHSPDTLKILHAGRQDLEILFQLTGRLPQPVFDTQIAATLLGYGDQISYAALVKDLFGADLDKSHTRTDWCQRPLAPEQLRYAADDAFYLGPLYQKQQELLRSRGRLGWLDEDFAALVDPATYQTDDAEAWRRVKGANTLGRRQLAALQALAGWREARAREEDRPRRWVLRDEVLIDMARRPPSSVERLSKIRGIEPALVKRRGAELIALLHGICQSPSQRWPELEPRLRLTHEQEARVDAAMAIVRLRAGENEVSVASLTNRRELERLVTGDSTVSLLHGWRRAIVGEDVQAFLAGDRRLVMDDGGLRLL